MNPSSTRHVRLDMANMSLEGGPPPLSPPLPSAASVGSGSSRKSSTIQSTQTPPTSVFSTPDAITTLFYPLETTSKHEPTMAPPSPSSSYGEQSTSTGYTNEAKDGLGPLPSDSTIQPWTQRLPLPSPPAQMGLSELLSGGSPLNSPSDDSGSHGRQSYFFRSYGERPKPHHRKSSTAEQDLALAANRDADGKRESAPGPSTPSVGSESSMRSSAQSATPRLPRVRNKGGVLAPHGTFSSATVPRLPPKDSSQSSTTSSSSRRRNQQHFQARKLTEQERTALEAASRTGDQLALHLLGYGADRDEDRHTLGLVNDVWGPVSSLPTTTYRSSQSTTSAGSGTNNRRSAQVDLLDEAVKLASRPSIRPVPDPLKDSSGG